MKLPILLSLLTLPASAVVNIDYVTVGNAGNAADPATGGILGAVSYEYKIAKNETTIAQYAEFLNAVAKTDTYGLYKSDMAVWYYGGISQTGSPGSFTYSVASGSANKPISFVSWFDSARFCNWLQNGQQTGIGAALTAETGAYTLNGATSGIITKNVGASVWIPSGDEWHKAAYYDPTKNAGIGGYWLHANQSDTMAINDIGVAGAANFYDANGYAAYISGMSSGFTDVGAYGDNSESYYGTNDQAGNAEEWNDAVISGSMRGLRGGSWNSNWIPLAAWSNYNADPTFEVLTGFRLASAIPEPSSAFLSLLSAAALLKRRRK